MCIKEKLCEVEIFQLQSMPYVIRCIDTRFAGNNLCLALIHNLSNPRTTIFQAKIGSRLQDLNSHFPIFFQIHVGVSKTIKV